MTCICSFDRNTSFTANEQRERIALSIHLENISLPKNNLRGIIIQRVSFSFFDEFRRERERFHLANLLIPIIRHLLHFQNTCLPRVFIRVNQHQRTLPRCLSLHSFEKRRKIKDIIIRVIGSLQTYEYSPFCLVLCNRDFTPSFFSLSLLRLISLSLANRIYFFSSPFEQMYVVYYEKEERVCNFNR